ncbi:MAG: 16S rRNA (guanine(527)-N(7))-methyltransferase RsmG [Clostridia bacterium]
MELFNQKLKAGAFELGVNLSDEQCLSFYNYYQMVVEYNKNVNLTAITDENDFIVKHFLDSLSAEKLIPVNSNICDIGAGAGFPSIPLKLARDDLSMTLMDALNKRVVFLDKAISELGLSKTVAVHIRAEDAGRATFREKFSCVVARAVADISVLAEYAIPLLKVGGTFIAYKGANIDELDGLEKVLCALKSKLIKIEPLCLPYSGDKRTLIVIQKLQATPSLYPRPQAKIKW